ncbi:uncharacterized protein LOC121978444 [Zingiber officinale]|uniref:uncharacterized protein LOC121978444 n=1 Tax=Zingiber officinale TaxID=94328 RepID=UPI001C4C7E1A|nr:uncharacterized protein LOC121978444 [Zingiber officinale]
MSYETAVKIDLSRADADQVKPTSTGPWGAPLFDKAIAYETSELSEPLVIEFPEMTSSTRRDHWLTLIKEVILLHRFILKFDIQNPIQAWEIHARSILGIFRLHAARELTRISSPSPANFLIFLLYEELPKGDYVLTELANTIKQKTSLRPCSANSILKGLNIYHVDSFSMERSPEENMNNQTDSLMSLGPTINQVREEAKEVSVAKATVEQMKGGGIADSLLVLVVLMSSVKNVLPRLQAVLSLERPMVTLFIRSVILIVIYKEMVGFAVALIALLIVAAILWARVNRIGERCREIVVNTTSDQTMMESIVAAEHSLNNLHELVKKTNIMILRIFSIIIGKAPKQANAVMWAMIAVAVLLVVIQFKYIVMGLTLYSFIAVSRIAKHMLNEQGNRRLKEWWESIPVIPVRTEKDSRSDFNCWQNGNFSVLLYFSFCMLIQSLQYRVSGLTVFSSSLILLMGGRCLMQIMLVVLPIQNPVEVDIQSMPTGLNLQKLTKVPDSSTTINTDPSSVIVY